MRIRNLPWIVFAAAMCCLFLGTTARGQSPFIRGDVNCDGVVDANDITALQNFLFNGVAIPCDDAADVNDDGLIDLADLTHLTNFVSSGAPVPLPPFPNCGLDPTPDALGCNSFCCGGGTWEHFKTWELEFVSFTQPVNVIDQFMADDMLLTGLQYLSNPAQKDSFRIIQPDYHLTWYQVSGRDTLLEVEYTNQFEQNTVVIDIPEYLLVPTQKLPHAPPDPTVIDHYKAYHIQNPKWFLRPTVTLDQFDPVPQTADSMRAVFFLTPASKNGEVINDKVRHYVAYEFTPQSSTNQARTLIDQFGGHDVFAFQSRYLLVPTLKLGFRPPGGEPDTLKNHYKTWRVDPIGGTFAGTATVDDQFMSDELVLGNIEYLSNPALKDTSDIKRPDDHLNWYPATGRDTVLRIVYDNQFGTDSLIIDQVSYLLVPCQKEPHPAPDSLLGHYKAYHVKSGNTYVRSDGLPITIMDQFDVVPEQIDSVVPRYFLNPAIKNGEPAYGPDTHYVAYEIYPKSTTSQARFTTDQFGVHELAAYLSELLLVPSHKITYHPPPPDTLKNHFKSWRVDPIGGTGGFTALVDDQFMSDALVLGPIEFLANPALKDTSDIKRPNDHLNWYQATGRDTVLRIVYDNQFGRDSLIIDQVSHLLVPCRKDPHPAPDSLLGHYKAYHVKSGHTYVRPDGLPITIMDQFDVTPELIDSVVPRYFLNPAIKNGEPAYGPDTHYVAYEIYPKSFISDARFTEDQFGLHELAAYQSELLLVPSHKITYHPPPPDTLKNHFKSWRVDPSGGTFAGTATVDDQFMSDDLVLGNIEFLSNPARKDTSDIKRPNDHLNWYRATGRDTLLQIEYDNQFGTDTLIIDKVSHLLVPCRKEPHPAPDSLLGHYKAYHVSSGHTYFRPGSIPIEILDQFDPLPELIDSVVPRYFLNPAKKNGEPAYGPDTHYVAYEIFPKSFIAQTRLTEDQFGPHQLTTFQSELLLVPSHKIAYYPPPTDTLKNHFKSWRLEPIPFDTTADVRDQWMSDKLKIGRINYLSNPARKDTFGIVKPDDHLLWYEARGRDTCMEVTYRNQFGTDTFVVGTISYLILPTQKFPHPPPDPTLDHYKAYKVWDPETFTRITQIQDQFDAAAPEIVDVLQEAYFLIPASKNDEPIHNDALHYVAYNIQPRTQATHVRDVLDQWGTKTIITLNSEMLLVPTEKLEFQPFCPILLPGDVNMDGSVTSADIIYLVNYVFKGGPPPMPCPAAGDVNCDGAVTSADIIYMVSYIFKGGAPPCDPCKIIPALWTCPC